MKFYKIFRNLIFLFPEEFCHACAIKFLKYRFWLSFGFLKKVPEYQELKTDLFGIEFSNPIGLAAGFDKNADSINSIFSYGFGFVEFGTVTPLPQFGNPKPRIFRIKKRDAIINRLGFNNLGIENFMRNIESNKNPLNIYGINIGKNAIPEDSAKDYLSLLDRVYGRSDYITINISSPNTKNLRKLHEKEELQKFLELINQKSKQLLIKHKKEIPILLKISPDLPDDKLKELVDIIKYITIDGVVISNTSVGCRIESDQNIEGGISGPVLFEKSNEIIRKFYVMTEGKIPIIGVGGISNAEDVFEKIAAGASLVQIYTALVYNGLGLIEEIKKDLVRILQEKGFNSIKEVVGINSGYYRT